MKLLLLDLNQEVLRLRECDMQRNPLVDSEETHFSSYDIFAAWVKDRLTDQNYLIFDTVFDATVHVYEGQTDVEFYHTNTNSKLLFNTWSS